jgi:hypothetical protein
LECSPEFLNGSRIHFCSRPGFFSWFGKHKIALPLALIAIGLIAAFLFRQAMIVSEAPTYAKITGYSAGYWLWLSSAIIATLGAVVGIVAKTK